AAFVTERTSQRLGARPCTLRTPTAAPPEERTSEISHIHTNTHTFVMPLSSPKISTRFAEHVSVRAHIRGAGCAPLRRRGGGLRSRHARPCAQRLSLGWSAQPRLGAAAFSHRGRTLGSPARRRRPAGPRGTVGACGRTVGCAGV